MPSVRDERAGAAVPAAYTDRMRRYTVLLTPEPEEGGYSVSVPALPGCFTQGDTYEEALANARGVIAFHLECLESEGQPIPDEQAAPELVPVEV